MVIWQIGDLDDSFREFIFTDAKMIDYQVPQDWKLFVNQTDPNSEPNWGEFPSFIYTYDDPQQIMINFCYLREYYNPVLRIRVTTIPSDLNTQLELYKGNVLCGIEPLENLQYYSYDFPLGYIQKGFHPKNRITIRSKGASDVAISFDTIYLYLDDTDTDGDGVSDFDEGDYSQDQDTVCIPLKSYDPSMIERISLHIEKIEGANPGFREVRFLDPNALSLPEWLCSDGFSPYGFLGFKVEGIGSENKITIQISYRDTLYPSARFYTYQGANKNNWQEMDFAFLDGNSAQIPLNDGGAGDFDEERDGAINTILTLSYPQRLNVHIEKGGCFIIQCRSQEKGSWNRLFTFIESL